MANRLKHSNPDGVVRVIFNVISCDGNANSAMRLKNVKTALDRGVEG